MGRYIKKHARVKFSFIWFYSLTPITLKEEFLFNLTSLVESNNSSMAAFFDYFIPAFFRLRWLRLRTAITKQLLGMMCYFPLVGRTKL